MGVLTRHIEVPDLYRYKPEFYKDGTERHIFCEGARYHVLSHGSSGTRCSAPKCEYNLPDKARIALIIDAALSAAPPTPGATKKENES